ncbi:hypothetical protein [Pandoraea sp. NPDC090278]|uniref:hypothetical protein n=1 Tax=Pandoraea sp. NPDC090278 TaxID=3364391 RepID=UPI003839E617
MASDVLIANRALTKIGAARITSLDDTSKSATTIASMFETVRDAELRAHRWHFAKARAKLAALATPPLFDFESAFQLPADYLSLIQVGALIVYPKTDTRGLFSIEGGQILTNLGAPLNIRYIKRITDPNLFDALFIEAFACRLAVESCEALTQSATKRQLAAGEYDAAVRTAIRMNAIERPSQPLSDDTWLESRGAGSTYDYERRWR